MFVRLTDVVIGEKDRTDFIAIIKNLLESVVQL